MSDLISREALIDVIESTDWYHVNSKGELVHGATSATGLYRFEDIMSALESALIVEAEPVVHAHWADRYGGKFANPLYECSGCLGKALFEIKVDALGHEHIAQMLSNYCPHCGAHMDEEVT